MRAAEGLSHTRRPALPHAASVLGSRHREDTRPADRVQIGGVSAGDQGPRALCFGPVLAGVTAVVVGWPISITGLDSSPCRGAGPSGRGVLEGTSPQLSRSLSPRCQVAVRPAVPLIPGRSPAGPRLALHQHWSSASSALSESRSRLSSQMRVGVLYLMATHDSPADSQRQHSSSVRPP